MYAEPVVYLGVDAGVRVVTDISVVVCGLHHTLLAEIAEGDVVVGPSLVAGDGNVVGLGRSVLPYEVVVRIVGTDTDLPVRAVHVPVTSIGHRGILVEGAAVLLDPCLGGVVTGPVDEPERSDGGGCPDALGRLDRVVQAFDTGQLIVFCHVLESDVSGICDIDLVSFPGALLRSDQDDTESSLGSVDGCRSGVLQDGDGLDVVRIDQVDGRDLYVVQKDERRRTSQVGSNLSADPEHRVGTHFIRSDADIEARGGTLESTADVSDRTAFQGLVHVDGRNGSGEAFFPLCAVTDHDDIVKELGIFFEDYDHSLRSRDGNALETDTGELQDGTFAYSGEGESSVVCRDRSGVGPLDTDSGSHNRGAVGVNDFSGDGPLLLRTFRHCLLRRRSGDSGTDGQSQCQDDAGWLENLKHLTKLFG